MGLEFCNIGYRFGRKAVLNEVGFSANEGEITCLLGPSGCGKTTLLRLAAGLLAVQSGEIRLDGKRIAAPGVNPPPERRRFGLVFQEGVLFPHLTVAQNVAFGLSGGAAPQRVSNLLAMIGLAGFEARYPHTLSGGQQQRVALARALALEPKVMLLDEPYSSLDSSLRRSLREETRLLFRDHGAATILVTHDPEEALEVGDKIIVMKEGRVTQEASPDDLYDRPKSFEIACLFGNARVLSADIADARLRTPFGDWPLDCLFAPPVTSAPLHIVVRSGALVIEADPAGYPVTDVRRVGAERLVFVRGPSDAIVNVSVPLDQNWPVGMRVSVRPKSAAIFGFPRTCETDGN